MKNLTKSLAALFVAILALPVFVGTAQAASEEPVYPNFRFVESETTPNTTADLNPIIARIKYVGSAASDGPTFEVDATTGDWEFTTDGTTVDSTVSTDGVVDVSDSSENTAGEACDAVNDSANWQCVLVDILPSADIADATDTTAETDTSTGLTATYKMMGESSGIFDEAGLALRLDTEQIDDIYVSIGPEWYPHALLEIDNLHKRQSRPISGGARWWGELAKVTAYADTTGNTADLEIYLVRQLDSNINAGSTEILIWKQDDLVDVTATSLDLTDLPEISTQGLQGTRIVVKLNDDNNALADQSYILIHGETSNANP